MSTIGSLVVEFLNYLSELLWFFKENHVLGSYTFEYAVATDAWEKEKEERVFMKLTALKVDLKSFLIRWRKDQFTDVSVEGLLPELVEKDDFFTTRTDGSNVQAEVQLLPELDKTSYFTTNEHDNCVEGRVEILSGFVQEGNYFTSKKVDSCVGGNGEVLSQLGDNTEILPQLLVKDNYFAVEGVEKSVEQVEMSQLEKNNYYELKTIENTVEDGVGVLSEFVEKNSYFSQKETEKCVEKHVELLPSFVDKSSFFGTSSGKQDDDEEIELLPGLSKDVIYYSDKASKGNVELFSELVTRGNYFVNKEKGEIVETGVLLPNLIDKNSYFTSNENDKHEEQIVQQDSECATLKANKNVWFDFNQCSSTTYNSEEDRTQSVNPEPKNECNKVIPNLEPNVPLQRTEELVKIKPVGGENYLYTCSTCDKSFKTKSSRNRHSRIHTGKKLFPCNCCDKTFSLRTSLESHLVRQHNANLNSAVPCPECGKLFVKKNALDVHLLKHKAEKSFLCEICGKTFTQKVSRDIHLLKHSGKYDYKCQLCNKEFPYQSLLNAHMYKHKTPRFSCVVCGKQYFRNDVLKRHMATHSANKTHQCSQCPKSFCTESSLTQHEKLHNDGPFRCHLCPAELKYKSGLKLHMKKHGIAPEASSSLRRKNTVQGQVAGGKHPCSVCGQEFETRDRLEEHELSHLQLGSEQAQPHFCHLCHKRFTQRSSLNQHVKTHLQVPSYKCEMCDRSFHRKDLYNKHMSTHSGQRPYSCAHCGKAFTFKSNLSAHLATHPGFSQRKELCCNDCGKLFKHKSSFKLHRKSHLGQFTHACETCGKKFMKLSHYESHIRSHQTERPFVCGTCGKGFKERKHYRQHVKKMHPNEFNLEALIASITCEDELLGPEPVPTDALFGGAQSVLGPDEQMMDKAAPSPSVGMFSPPASFPNLEPLLQDISSVNFIATSLDEQHQSLAPLAVLSSEDTTSVLSQRLEP